MKSRPTRSPVVGDIFYGDPFVENGRTWRYKYASYEKPLGRESVTVIEIIAKEIEPMSLTVKSRKMSDLTRERKTQDILADMNALNNELNNRLHSVKEERPTLMDPQDVYHLFKPLLCNPTQEELWVACLNTRSRVVCIYKLYQGSLNSSLVRVGEVFRRAILESAASIIIAHNHPSGDSTPSNEDIALTRGVHQAGKLLDIDLVDHLILSQESYTSLRQRGVGF